jgi:hypothetical protein
MELQVVCQLIIYLFQWVETLAGKRDSTLTGRLDNCVEFDFPPEINGCAAIWVRDEWH